MRIIIDARYLDGTFSGIATYSTQLLEHLSLVDQKNEYTVLVRPGFHGRIDLGENFELMSYGPQPISLSTMFRLGRSVDALGADLMHSLFPLAPMVMRTPLMISIHDLQPFVDPDFSSRRLLPMQWGYNTFYRRVYPATLSRSRWAITASRYTRNLVAELLPDHLPKVLVVPSGLAPDLRNPTIEGNPASILQDHGVKEPYLLYYGSTRPNKNIPMQLRGFARYLEESGDTETTFVMILKKDRFFREIRRVIKTEALEGRVRILDQLPTQKKRAILARARAMMFVTKYEGFGFPALESMAAGVPVLSAQSGALDEICGHGAEYADPDDPNDIARGIAVVLHNQMRRAELLEHAHQRIQVFDWKLTAEHVRDIYSLLF
ncbi:MAG: glycosyltransferase family 4 protein [Candidatus Sumerlaeia bacterium]|nr:glycosyltransferase family 4 protein [Candidatus Sumerlaeia bacterium]